MRITLIQPAIGHRPGEPYIRSWQMEPLPIATLAGLTPANVDLRFFDDRLEAVPFDAPTDAVAIPVETYTARRSYQIALRYRERGVRVIMGGFHPTLVPEEASRFADAIVIGEAESVWKNVVEDLVRGTLEPIYRGVRGDLTEIVPDRRIFAGKRYLPIGLVETGRGCRFPCEFCAIQTFFGRSYRARPTGHVIRELQSLRNSNKLLFFVDDNFAGQAESGTELLCALERLKLRWITQMSIHAAHDEDFVQHLVRAGCRGVLIGFESLDDANLALMNKRFNSMKTGYVGALANLRKHGIAVYGTFMFGYDHDTVESFEAAVEFALAQDLYLAAFNHVTPFPGTPLYRRLSSEGRLRFDAWWLDAAYRYNDLPFVPRAMSADEVTRGCLQARRRFYAWPSIFKRCLGNLADGFMFRNFFAINALHRYEVSRRDGFPLGDEGHPILAASGP